jgi:hypothetical protein
MGRLRFGQCAWLIIIISGFVLSPACGGNKPPAGSFFPAVVTLSPAPSYSLQLGTVVQFTASARNARNTAVNAAFTYTSSNPGVLDVAPNGSACAGSWNAPYYSVCSPGGLGPAGQAVQVIAQAAGVTSAPTQVFVHPFIARIQVSVVLPVNSPPAACPAQIALPAACQLLFNRTTSCLSQNQVTTFQATAYDSNGNDITTSVGPFSWSQGNVGVATLTPIVTVSYYNVPTNQVTASPATPGQTPLIASASGVSSAPFYFETCPVQCIALELNVTGSEQSTQTTFVASKGTPQTVTATAVDVQGCIVPKAPLTWISSEPAALTAGSATTGCTSASPTCTISTTQPGASAITASCTPPTCNIGFPLNLSGVLGPYIPQPVYPVTAISGLVTGTTTTTSVLATSQNCYSDILCGVGIYDISTSTNLAGGANPLPAPPNSLMFDPAGDKAYVGSEFGAFSISPANFGTSTGPFTSLPVSGTTLGAITGKILAVSHNGAAAVFSDTVDTPNQVYVVNTTFASTTPFNINSAIAAAFSPDGLKTFILGDGGNTLYIYSTLQPLQPPVPLGTPATSAVFNSTGSFALFSGGTPAGAPAGSLALYNTCDNSSVTLNLPVVTPAPPPLPGPPLFLKMVPAVDVPLGSLFGGILIPDLETTGLDFFFGLDNTGIDIIATNSSPAAITALCPNPVTLAYAPTTPTTPPTPPPPPTPQDTFAPVHININQGTFNPIAFFLAPDAVQAYIVTSDLGVLVYNFNTHSTTGIPLSGNATPVAADMTIDGSRIYVAGSDNLLHILNTATFSELQAPIFFTDLPNSTNSFCYTGSNCALNMVAVKP